MVKIILEQNLRSRNFEARNGKIESGTVVKSQREQRRVQKRTRKMWAMESQRAVSASSFSRTFDATGWKIQRGRKVSEAAVRLGKSLVFSAESTLKVLVRIHLVLIGILWSVFFVKDKSVIKFGEEFSFAHRQET